MMAAQCKVLATKGEAEEWFAPEPSKSAVNLIQLPAARAKT